MFSILQKSLSRESKDNQDVHQHNNSEEHKSGKRHRSLESSSPETAEVNGQKKSKLTRGSQFEGEECNVSVESLCSLASSDENKSEKEVVAVIPDGTPDWGKEMFKLLATMQQDFRSVKDHIKNV